MRSCVHEMIYDANNARVMAQGLLLSSYHIQNLNLIERSLCARV